MYRSLQKLSIITQKAGTLVFNSDFNTDFIQTNAPNFVNVVKTSGRLWWSPTNVYSSDDPLVNWVNKYAI